MQCPKCGKAFTALPQDAIVPVRGSSDYQDQLPHDYDAVPNVEPSVDNYPLDVRRAGAPGNWQTVRAGLMWILLYSVSTLGISWCTSLNVLLNKGSEILFILGWITNACLLLLTLIGACLCFTAPDPRAKKSAYFAVFFLALAFAIAVPAITLRGFLAVLTPEGLLVVLVVLGIATILSWCLFHVAVAAFFQNSSLRSLSIMAAVFSPVVFGTCIFLLLAIHAPLLVKVPLPWFIGEGGNDATGVTCIIVLVSSTVVFGMQLVLCVKTIRILNAITAAGY